MLFKGKRDGYYLYELTDADLVLVDQQHASYALGNVLFFKNKKKIALGLELLKADDLNTALEYLEGSTEFVETSASRDICQDSIDALRRQLAQSESNLQKRDDLLSELTSDMESQRYSNQLLIAQLESLSEQISIEKLSRNEVIGDLEIVSAETYRKDQELEKVQEAKTMLEQELAEHICRLIELDAANADLEKRLAGRSFADTDLLDADAALPVEQTSAHSHTPATGLSAQILTAADGKQIQIYHEFPRASASLRKRSSRVAYSTLRMLCFVLIAIILFAAGSVVATAHFNDISWGEALDMTTRSFQP